MDGMQQDSLIVVHVKMELCRVRVIPKLYSSVCQPNVCVISGAYGGIKSDLRKKVKPPVFTHPTRVGATTMAPTPRTSTVLSSSKSICEYYYTVASKVEWQCKKCLKLKCKSGGWTNLLSHIRSCIGADYEKLFVEHKKHKASASSSILSGLLVRVSDKEKEMHYCAEESTSIIC